MFLLGSAGDAHWFLGHRAGLTNGWAELGLNSDHWHLKSLLLLNTNLTSCHQKQNIFRKSFMDMNPAEESLMPIPPLTQSL